MNATTELKRLLFEELGLIVRTSGKLILKIRPEHWEHRPAANMRSLGELVHHLVAVPATDLFILKEKNAEEVRELEAGIAAGGTDAEKLIASMENGTADLKRYMEELAEEDFLGLKTKPFYLEHGATQAKWLIEIVTHAQHHRAQMFTYMKTLGYDINMFDLY